LKKETAFEMRNKMIDERLEAIEKLQRQIDQLRDLTP